ncbi:hypothetical protein Pgy4_34001, partial [Pseudomonas savastanoi pv. glycinea str. race 4]
GGVVLAGELVIVGDASTPSSTAQEAFLMAKAPGPDSITGSPKPPTVPEQFRVPLVGLESRAFGDKPMRVA